MICRVIGAVSAAALTLSAAGQDRFGTAQEARAMLDKAVAAVKADKTKALDMFNKGEGGFLDRDLYPFCFNISDGKIVAVGNPNAKNKQFLGRTVGPFTTPPVTHMAWKCTPRRRSRKVKSLRSAICFQDRARTRRRFRR